eukprot:4695984-Prymnesium_polylepis.1
MYAKPSAPPAPPPPPQPQPRNMMKAESFSDYLARRGPQGGTVAPTAAVPAGPEQQGPLSKSA